MSIRNKYENNFLLLDKIFDLIYSNIDEGIYVEGINTFFGELLNYGLNDIKYNKTTDLSFILTILCIFKDNNY